MSTFSVIIPVYNVEKYVERCVDSLLYNLPQQTEIILVDDGSTDCSGMICDNLADECQSIKVIHKANGGLASARNAGLSRAQGEYIAFIDSDDWVTPDFWRVICETADKYSADVIKFGYHRVENGKITSSSFPCLPGGVYLEHQVREVVYPAALGNGKLFDFSETFIMSSCMTIYRKEFLNAVEICFKSERKILNEDILFNLEILPSAGAVCILHDCIYCYDCREGSLTQCHKLKMFEREKALFEAYEEAVFCNRKFQQNNVYCERYAQFMIEQIYDCLVNACLWNKTITTRNKEMKEILCDKRLTWAVQNLGK